MAEEVWKVVESHPEFEVSSTGKIRNNKTKTIINGHKVCGYIRIGLGKKYGKNKTIAAHRLIAEAFIPNPENKPQVDHIDNIKHHNNVENLRWVTQEENIQNNWKYRKANNIKPKRRKIVCVETNKIYNSYRKAAADYNIHNKRIYDVLVGFQQTAGGVHWKFVED